MKKTVCAGGFIVVNDQFLFGKRSTSKDWAPGAWDIAGGKSKKNELPLDTLKREIFEELAIKVTEAQLLRTIQVEDHSKRGFFTCHIYMISAYNGFPMNASDEHSEIKWFTRTELKSMTLAIPGYLKMIDDWLSANQPA